MKFRFMPLGLSLLLAAVVGAPATMAQDTGIAADHGRVSFADEDALVKGTADAEWAYATMNSLILAGDTVWADESGAVELEFGGGTFLRMADGSKVDIVSLPPSADFRAWSGSFYVQRMNESTGSVELRTPVAEIDIAPSSQVRVDVLQQGATTVSVRWGTAVVRTETGADVEVRSGFRTYVDPGYLPATPTPFERSAEDAFDAWNRERARLFAVGTENIPVLKGQSYSQAPIGISDLNSYGDWVYVDDNYYWQPTVIREYVPYRTGYWNYVPSYGYNWIEPYPFSYITTHYGFWDYHHRHGWLWSYHPHFSPAYVAAVHHGSHFYWTPINRFHRPVHYGSSHFSVGGLHFSVGVTSFAYGHDVFGGYAYGHPFHSSHLPYFQHGYGHGDTNIFIWNFNNYDRDFHRNVFRDSNLRVRDYNPRRVLRGPESLGSARSVLASNRVANLESRLSRSQFSAVDGRSLRNRETSIAPSQRQASVRRVALDRTAMRDTTQAVERAQRTVRANRDLVASREGRTTITNDDAFRMNRRDVTRSTTDTRATRENPFSRGDVTTRERGTVGETDAVRDRGSVRASVPDDARRSTRTQTPASARVTSPSDRGVSSRGTIDRTPAPRETIDRVESPRSTVRDVPTARSTRETVDSPRSTVVERPDRATVERPQADRSQVQRPESPRATVERPQVQAPSTRGTVDRPTPRTTRSAAPGAINARIDSNPRSTISRTTQLPRSTEARPTVTQPTRPTVEPRSNVRATVPTPSRDIPSTRGTVAPSQSRSYERSTPSRPSYTPPTVSRSAPSRPSYTPPTVSRSAPSRPSYTPPTVSRSAPSRPSYTPPTVTRSAPSRPSYSTPSPSRTSPSFSQPSSASSRSALSNRSSSPSRSSIGASSGSISSRGAISSRGSVSRGGSSRGR